MFTMVKFSDWLDEMLTDRGWTRAELSRRAGISQSTLSMIYSGSRNLGDEAGNAIAKAFNVPAETVYRAAGLLPPAPNVDDDTARLLHQLGQLPPEEKRRIMAQFRVLLEHTINELEDELLRQKTQPQQNQPSRSRRPARSVKMGNRTK